jgi:transmembrane sensor
VRLQAGEALFEVARDASRPFVVESGGREVRALGTSFIVRREAGQLAVILMEGKVRVAPTTGSHSDGSGTRTFQVTGQQSASGRADSVMADAAASIVLVPGQRLMVTDSADQATVDRPRLEPLTAWQRGLVALDYTPLSEAIAEMNRYSDVKLVIDDPRIGSARISGVFRAGDSSSFALAVAKTHGLRLVEQGRQITLSTQTR